MTVQEYKEKIIHTIEQMEMEHKISVNSVEVIKCDDRWEIFDKISPSNDKWLFKMVTR